MKWTKSSTLFAIWRELDISSVAGIFDVVARYTKHWKMPVILEAAVQPLVEDLSHTYTHSMPTSRQNMQKLYKVLGYIYTERMISVLQLIWIISLLVKNKMIK